MRIKDQIIHFQNNLPEGVRLIAVSKTKPSGDILTAYEAGQRLFGENKAREMEEKADTLPDDIQWHFIGHIQTNKVKYIAKKVHLIHSVDSLKVLQEIDRQAARNERIIHVLLQFHIAQEESKFGLDLEEAEAILNSEAYRAMQHIHIAGVMGMATYTDEEPQIRKEFRTLKRIFDTLKNNYFREDTAFKEISMGMSGDYPIAIDEGATLIRVGSLIFGARHYQ
ncbi:MAG: YggS family pyridoxal phosphate-dependent enzyme [Bacteroidetes bacterium]|nr:MAG: YggS family pyridoxal phosphate-dependent enzyme [Bacteroidota bacterium]PIE87688.1 MAG: YggS family pyridoxal phosphate-dependent enzyme [Bacteroidota bacterium]